MTRPAAAARPGGGQGWGDEVTRFGDAVREARLTQTISLARVAYLLKWEHAVNATPAMVSGIERGQSVELLESLATPYAAILGLDADRLRFLAHADASERGQWGVAKVLTFVDYRDGPGDVLTHFYALPWLEDDRVIAGPFGSQGDAEREADRLAVEYAEEAAGGA